MRNTHGRVHCAVVAAIALLSAGMIYTLAAWLSMGDAPAPDIITRSSLKQHNPADTMAVRGKVSTPSHWTQQAAPGTAHVPADTPRVDFEPTVVLSTGGGKWNTGVWPGYGQNPAQLQWAAAGAVAHKTCPVQCKFTDDQSQLSSAHAVMMETVNAPKFLGPGQAASDSIRIPTGNSRPVTIQFYYEPASRSYAPWMAELEPQFDIVAAPHAQLLAKSAQSSGVGSQTTEHRPQYIPLTLACPFGAAQDAWLGPPGPKTNDKFMAYFSELGPPPGESEFIGQLLQLGRGSDVGVHSFHRAANAQAPADVMPGAAFSIAARIDFLRQYKFVLITDGAMDERGYFGPELAHALLAGAVPVYFGTPAVAAFMPEDSWVNAANFESAEELWRFLHRVGQDDGEYQVFFDWKWQGPPNTLPASLANAIDACVHYAECRICAAVHARLAQSQQ